MVPGNDGDEGTAKSPKAPQVTRGTAARDPRQMERNGTAQPPVPTGWGPRGPGARRGLERREPHTARGGRPSGPTRRRQAPHSVQRHESLRDDRRWHATRQGPQRSTRRTRRERSSDSPSVSAQVDSEPTGTGASAIVNKPLPRAFSRAHLGRPEDAAANTPQRCPSRSDDPIG